MFSDRQSGPPHVVRYGTPFTNNDHALQLSFSPSFPSTRFSESQYRQIHRLHRSVAVDHWCIDHLLCAYLHQSAPAVAGCHHRLSSESTAADLFCRQCVLGEFGEEKRSLVKLDAIPANLKNAVLAIEDYRFYQHGGIDYIGIARALATDVIKGHASQGASTITMQVARNVFLTKEKTVSRKLYEVLLANKIEATLSKDQILEVYMHQIYLGRRAFGFAAAARTYFGKDLKDITLAQAAMLAGLPKAPSAYNPIVNPERAKIRQQYILQRMLDLEYITLAQYNAATKEDIQVRAPGNQYNVHAEYVTEMVRQLVYA